MKKMIFGLMLCVPVAAHSDTPTPEAVDPTKKILDRFVKDSLAEKEAKAKLRNNKVATKINIQHSSQESPDLSRFEWENDPFFAEKEIVEK